MSISVIDPWGVTADPAMPSLALALDPTEVQRQFARSQLAKGGVIDLQAIRVTRYKPGRRCVIEYEVGVDRPGLPKRSLTLLGKVRRARFGRSGYRLLKAISNAGFGSGSEDGISVPKPIATIPGLRMWLQRKVPGAPATDLLTTPSGGMALARRIAEASHKLHQAGVSAERRHTLADELRILRECMQGVAQVEPRWGGRIERILNACERLGSALPEPSLCGIHRDFYSDQVIVDGSRLWLIDFDLYCQGDPALDIGNFIGHITEQSLRTLGDPEKLADVEQAMEERFVELAGVATRTAVRAYATLTLVRHVYLSTLFLERRPFTGNLLELCEARLGVGR